MFLFVSSFESNELQQQQQQQHQPHQPKWLTKEWFLLHDGGKCDSEQHFKRRRKRKGKRNCLHDFISRLLCFGAILSTSIYKCEITKSFKCRSWPRFLSLTLSRLLFAGLCIFVNCYRQLFNVFHPKMQQFAFCHCKRDERIPKKKQKTELKKAHKKENRKSVMGMFYHKQNVHVHYEHGLAHTPRQFHFVSRACDSNY